MKKKQGDGRQDKQKIAAELATLLAIGYNEAEKSSQEAGRGFLLRPG